MEDTQRRELADILLVTGGEIYDYRDAKKAGFDVSQKQVEAARRAGVLPRWGHGIKLCYNRRIANKPKRERT